MRANPANGLPPPAPRVRRSRVLSPAELIALWDAAEEMSPRLLGYPFTQLLRLLILTGKRRDAVANMRVDELDLPPGIDTGIWTPTTLAPGLGGTERVSLPPLARRLVQQGLDNRPYCDSPFVFLTR